MKLFPSFLTVDEMAEVLRIGRNTAYELLRSNQIRFFYVGRQIRIYKADLLAYMGEKES